MNLMTIMYMMIQEVLADSEELKDLEAQLREYTGRAQLADQLIRAQSP